MRTLEQTLGEVERLRRDLSAEIVVQEGEEHQEEQYTERSDWNAYYRETENVWIVDKPRIAESDTEKRRNARTGLQEQYNSSLWYSARYAAGRALFVRNEELKRQIESWTGELGEKLQAKKMETRDIEEERWETVHYPVKRYYDEQNSSYERVYHKVGEETVFLIDEKERLSVVEDAERLLKISNSPVIRRFLERVYNAKHSFYVQGVEDSEMSDRIRNSEFANCIRREAGKALGYSYLRINMNLHPVTTAIMGVIVAGASSALGYLLYQYLSR